MHINQIVAQRDFEFDSFWPTQLDSFWPAHEPSLETRKSAKVKLVFSGPPPGPCAVNSGSWNAPGARRSCAAILAASCPLLVAVMNCTVLPPRRAIRTDHARNTRQRRHDFSPYTLTIESIFDSHSFCQWL